MPNHCANILRVVGPQDELVAFRVFARGKGPAWDGKAGERDLELDLHKFVPIPDDVLNAKKNNHSDAYNSGGYEWCVANWGTKWGVYDVESKLVSGELRYDFMTAWSPFNLETLEAMSGKFPALKFEMKYGEGGSGFAGIMTAEDGDGLDTYVDDGRKLAKRDEEISMLMENSG